jgi:hypothetical protein
MAKRRYRSAKINKIETSRLLEAIVGDRIVVGVDVAKEDLFASIMDERQHVHCDRSLEASKAEPAMG